MKISDAQEHFLKTMYLDSRPGNIHVFQLGMYYHSIATARALVKRGLIKERHATIVSGFPIPTLVGWEVTETGAAAYSEIVRLESLRRRITPEPEPVLGPDPDESEGTP